MMSNPLCYQFLPVALVLICLPLPVGLSDTPACVPNAPAGPISHTFVKYILVLFNHSNQKSEMLQESDDCANHRDKLCHPYSLMYTLTRRVDQLALWCSY